MSENRIKKRKKGYYARCDGGPWEKTDHVRRRRRRRDGKHGSTRRSEATTGARERTASRRETSDEGVWGAGEVQALVNSSANSANS